MEVFPDFIRSYFKNDPLFGNLRRLDISSNSTKYPEGTTRRSPPSSSGMVTDAAEMSIHGSVSFSATPFLAENVSRLLFQKLKTLHFDDFKSPNMESYAISPPNVGHRVEELPGRYRHRPHRPLECHSVQNLVRVAGHKFRRSNLLLLKGPDCIASIGSQSTCSVILLPFLGFWSSSPTSRSLRWSCSSPSATAPESSEMNIDLDNFSYGRPVKQISNSDAILNMRLTFLRL